MVGRTEARAGSLPLVRAGQGLSPRLRRAWRVARANPLGVLGGLLVLTLVVVGLFAPVIAPYPINEFSGLPARGPTAEHIFGTDKFGQDIFSRVVHGARISLQVGFLAVGIGTLAGMAIGILSGYMGGVVDTVLMRFTDLLISWRSRFRSSSCCWSSSGCWGPRLPT